MLYDLFTNNKLEYVHVGTEFKYNIVRSMTLNHNIKNLRYMNIDIHDKRATICLDITNEYPTNLVVYSIPYYGRKYYGSIQGPEQQKQRLIN